MEYEYVWRGKKLREYVMKRNVIILESLYENYISFLYFRLQK